MIAFAFKADREFCVMVVVGFVLFAWYFSSVGWVLLGVFHSQG